MNRHLPLPLCPLLLPAILLAACDQKPLCFDHDAHTLRRNVAIVADYEQAWEYTYDGPDWAAAWPTLALPLAYDDLRPDIPTGLRILDYPPAGGVTTYNLEPAGGTLGFSEGPRSLLFYNNGTQYILFDELDSYALARATTRVRSRASYLGSPYSKSGEEETTVNAPDMLFGHYMDLYEPVAALQEQSLAVTLRPLTFTYLILYDFASGGERVDIARGALAGMAKDVYLNSGRTAPEPATILFECDDVNDSGARAQVLSFGVPDFPNDSYTRAERSYGLNLEVKLSDGTVADFDFDVTDQVAAQPRGGVIRVDGIEIPATGSSGSLFTVDVIDWGDDHYIDLPI